MVTQGDWLMRLGIAERARRLQAAGDAGAAQALHRLTAPGEMGHLFKVLAEQANAPKWNFYKYVIARDGQSVVSFNSMADPKSGSFVREVEKQLAVR